MNGCVQGMFVLGEGLDMELCKNMKLLADQLESCNVR